MMERYAKLELDQNSLEQEQNKIKSDYVTHRHFEAIIPQLQRTMDEVRGDIKKLLTMARDNARPIDEQ